jgi:hypothetical protein
MTMIGVRIAALGLALAVLFPSSQACAFGLRLGPFLLGGRAHHHHRHLVRRPTETLHSEATPTDFAQNRASLLYPILAWPSFADDISDRPTIPPGRSATGKSNATLRIGREIAPAAAQQPLLQKLGMRKPTAI